MKPNRRISILTFPQRYADNKLFVNVVVLPRNQNPLQPCIEQHPSIPDSVAFADAQLTFEAKIFPGLNIFPHNLAPVNGINVNPGHPGQKRQLFESLGNHFKIQNQHQANINLTNNTDKAESAVPRHRSVKKYLPRTYRKAFNFTSPRTPNATTDDTFHCAVKNAGYVAGFQPSPETVSWGKVFAFLMRQPFLAAQAGLIYQVEVPVDVNDFQQGGWLYLDLAAGSDLKAQQDVDHTFVQLYAARIPKLEPGESRQLFAPVLFPVLHKNQPADPDPAPDGNFDELFIEAATYDDGFAKILHSQQPPNRNLLLEENDGGHPVKESGIRLGWDDEQILVWYMRQLTIDTTVTDPDQRLDAPLGVFGYAVDVRLKTGGNSAWTSLNRVRSRNPLVLADDPNDPNSSMLELGAFEGELPYQVYPMQLDGNTNGAYWLPMYFTAWTGKSMVLPDPTADQLYHTTDPQLQPDPVVPLASGSSGTGVSGPAKNNLSQVYEAVGNAPELRYGNLYEFRVRLMDLSGGGPSDATVPVNETGTDTTSLRLKRYVAPNQPRIQELIYNSDETPDYQQFTIDRPLLGYPGVVYTGKYSDPVTLLQQASDSMIGKEAFGIPDPDVDRVEITVEVQALKLDKLLSLSGKEDYIHLYTTFRQFPAVNQDQDYFNALQVPVVYRDVKVLHTGNQLDLVNDLQLGDDLDNLTEIVLPTARQVRLTFRSVCEEKANNDEYYGNLDAGRKDFDNRFSEIIQVLTYKASSDESGMLIPAAPAQRLRAIYLQEDPEPEFDGRLTTLLLGKRLVKKNETIERLASQLDLKSKGMTLVAPKGQRVQFGCSNRIRHTLSPDHAAITFASEGDLINHWLCCLVIDLERDWMWDALEDRSLVVNRSKRFTHDPPQETEQGEVGDIEIRHTISFEALQQPDRNYTRLIFIDAVEPKNSRTQPNGELRFPDTIELNYELVPKLKPGHGSHAPESVQITLPITTPPAQVPKIASVGLALSPYNRNEKYSSTQPRQRFVWVEFEEGVKDPQDIIFARVLATAPDQLISNNKPELLAAPSEPSLPLDPELMRVIAPGSSNDLAGLNAMQPMEKANDSDRHYLLPLPPGLHAESPELFGFFTYEFRAGHYRHPESQEMVWTTAQGRYGRALRATGMQHPVPTLTCVTNRDQDKLWVTAPYAVAVHNGKNVTADPPRTQLWGLLYAQVKQADNQDYRNILIDDKQLDWRVQVNAATDEDQFEKYSKAELELLKHIAVKNFHDDVNYVNYKQVFQLKNYAQINKDATKYGTAAWTNNEVAQLLSLFGLPADSPLSVVVVEFLPQITNLYEHISGLGKPKVNNEVQAMMMSFTGERNRTVDEYRRVKPQQAVQRPPSPASDELGHHRIMRTSPLTAIPEVCCPDCGNQEGS